MADLTEASAMRAIQNGCAFRQAHRFPRVCDGDPYPAPHALGSHNDAPTGCESSARIGDKLDKCSIKGRRIKFDQSLLRQDLYFDLRPVADLSVETRLQRLEMLAEVEHTNHRNDFPGRQNSRQSASATHRTGGPE